MSSKEFVHLHLHTDYSLLDGACAIERLMGHAKSLNMPAVSITDHGNLFGLVDFYSKARKHEIKPLLGCEIYFTPESRLEKPKREENKIHHMGLMAKNFKGYQNLIKLVSDSHIKGMYYKPRADMTTLAAHAEGLIGFTGCMQSVVCQSLLKEPYQVAREWVGRFVEIFGRENYFVEIQDHGIPEQRQLIPGLLKLAEEFKLKVVCTNDVHYVKEGDAKSHDALLCIQTGAKIKEEKRMRYASNQFYLKSYEEMERLFHEHPQSLTNTLAVAEMCDLELPFGKNHYPVFHSPPEIKTQFPENPGYLKELCIKGLQTRYGLDYHHPEQYQKKEEEADDIAEVLVKRLDYELSIIEKTGFVDYFLIVQDFIGWALEQKIPVGPGRGSGAGCLVAYLTHITDIDPLRFGLLFERFLNPERVSPPDFDIDFCMRRRDEVVEYVRNKYGKDSVANIITFGTFGAKMVVRDLARVLDLEFSESNRLAKMVPDDLNISLDDAVKNSTELANEVENSEVAKQIIDHGQVIEGMVRNTGKHACGIIIADRPLDEFVPLTLQEGDLTTQYPKEPVEEFGLLKMDFLGLKTLTVIADAQENVRMLTGEKSFDISSVAYEDQKTFGLLNSGQTVGVFQLESGGMRNLCRQFKVASIDEIMALIALYRPGPMSLIPDYIKGKHDPSTVKYPHPLLEDVCRETYGIMVYQEQVMQAARIIAGYSLGEADILRKAMGKKKVDVMEQEREKFIQRAEEQHDINQKVANEIFELLLKFAGYGFNKAHSAGYAILSYQTAYFKANYPVAFMAALLSSELRNAEKLTGFIAECKVMGLDLRRPDINQSRENFTPVIEQGKEGEDHAYIRFGIAAIKGVGDSAAKNILAVRDSEGDFEHFDDFISRVDTTTVNKRVIENLIKTGGFDSFGQSRSQLLDEVDAALKEAARQAQAPNQGCLAFWDQETRSKSIIRTNPRAQNGSSDDSSFPLSEQLYAEKDLLGFYLSGHPMDDCCGIDRFLNSFEPEEFDQLEHKTRVRLCGVIASVEKKISKRNKQPWAIMTLGTRSNDYKVMVYSNTFQEYEENLTEGRCVMVLGEIKRRDNETNFTIDTITSLGSALRKDLRSLTWILQPGEAANDFIPQLREALEKETGQLEVRIGFIVEEKKVALANISSALTWSFSKKSFKYLREHPAVAGVLVRTEELGEAPQHHPKRVKKAS